MITWNLDIIWLEFRQKSWTKNFVQWIGSDNHNGTDPFCLIWWEFHLKSDEQFTNIGSSPTSANMTNINNSCLIKIQIKPSFFCNIYHAKYEFFTNTSDVPTIRSLNLIPRIKGSCTIQSSCNAKGQGENI